MDDHCESDGYTLCLQLDVQLDCQPIQGRIRTEWGTEERFVGWLAFLDVLRTLHDLRPASSDPAENETGAP